MVGNCGLLCPACLGYSGLCLLGSWTSWHAGKGDLLNFKMLIFGMVYLCALGCLEEA